MIRCPCCLGDSFTFVLLLFIYLFIYELMPSLGRHCNLLKKGIVLLLDLNLEDSLSDCHIISAIDRTSGRIRFGIKFHSEVEKPSDSRQGKPIGEQEYHEV